MTGGAGSDAGCRSSLLLGSGSSGGRGSSQGKGSGGRGANKGVSSGGSKKKAGWEDAELEFYKEAYPMPPHEGGYSQHLATLLPSTRYVNTMGRGTVQRRRRRSTRRRRADQQDHVDGAGRTMLSGAAGANATWVRTGRRGSDTYLEVLPDLTKGVDEEQTWEELQEVRCQPVSLSEKRRLKRQLLAAPTLRTRGWQAVHLTRRKITKRLSVRVRGWLSHLELWRSKLRYVEGNFGTGLVALFTFIKWLLFLNLFMSAVIILFILLPQLLFTPPVDPCVGDELLNGTERLARSSSLLAMPSAPPTPSPFGCCHVPYRATVQQRLRLVQELPLKDQIFDYLLQVLQGTGLLEYSPIFYGFYTKETIYVPWGDTTKSYELPLAYLSAMLFLMAFCLVVMVRKAAQGLRENLRSTEGEFYQVCNLIFGGWDFCVDNNKAARVKHRAIYNEFCRHLDAERFREEKEMRSRKERLCLYLMRLLINVLVLGIIVGAFVMVWYVTTFSFGQLRQAQASVTADNNASFASALTSSNSSLEFLDSYSEVTYGINNSHATGPIFVGSEHVTFTPEAASNAADTTWRSVMTSQDVVSAEYDTAFDADDVVYDTQTPIDAVGVGFVPDTSNAAPVESQVEFVPDSSNAVPVESQIEFVPDTSSAVQDESEHLHVASTSGAAQVLRSTPVARLVTASSSSFTPLLTNAKTTSAFSVDEGLEKVSEEPASGDDLHPLLMLVYRYLPSATIIALNIFVPLLFNQLVLLERYSTTVVLRLTLMRTVVLRLASLGVLLYALRSFTLRSYTVDCPTPSLHNCASANCKGQVLCWETYVGQELYKLTLLDLAVTAFNTFFVNLLRKVVGQHLLKRTSFGQRVGAMEFEIPKHVLDIVYGQTLCWLGMFYAPLLPLITAFKLVLVFYIKYFDCSFNSRQSSQFYRTSRSNALFISILLISFIVTIIPVGYSIVDLTPSLGCGPFRGLDAIWTQMVNLVGALPEWIQSVVFFLGTAGFAVPTIVLLSLAGYYYYAVASANQHLVLMLKGQLVLEGHDKQFLLNRLDLLIKRVNEDDARRRRHHRRNSDVSPGASNDITLQIGASR